MIRVQAVADRRSSNRRIARDPTIFNTNVLSAFVDGGPAAGEVLAQEKGCHHPCPASSCASAYLLAIHVDHECLQVCPLLDELG